MAPKTHRPLISIMEPDDPPVYEFTDYDTPEPRIQSSNAQKPMFRYKVSLGQFPKEAESYNFVKRKDPLSKKVRIVPDMVYPLEANRIPIPKHQVLEDDWRAFRSVYHNYQSLLRSQMDPVLRGAHMLQMTFIITEEFKLHPRDPRQLIHEAYKRAVAPRLAIYKDLLDPPSGFMYRRFKDQGKLRPRPSVTPHGIPLRLPLLVFEGPYVNVAYMPHAETVEKEMAKELKNFDTDVISGGPDNRELYLYNEPDAVPMSFVRTDFSESLPRRVVDIIAADLAGNGEPQTPVTIPLPIPPRG